MVFTLFDLFFHYFTCSKIKSHSRKEALDVAPFKNDTRFHSCARLIQRKIMRYDYITRAFSSTPAVISTVTDVLQACDENVTEHNIIILAQLVIMKVYVSSH